MENGHRFDGPPLQIPNGEDAVLIDHIAVDIVPLGQRDGAGVDIEVVPHVLQCLKVGVAVEKDVPFFHRRELVLVVDVAVGDNAGPLFQHQHQIIRQDGELER